MNSATKMEIMPYGPARFDEWDHFVETRSINGTFLHTRQFLSYHRHKFKDQSMMISRNGKLIALFPAALDPSSEKTIISHPGITYGGLVVDGTLRGQAVIDTFELLKGLYSEQGIELFQIKQVPHVFCNAPYQDDSYAFFRLGASLYRCDLSSTIDLSNRGKLTKGRKYEIRKGQNRGIEIHEGHGDLENFFVVLQENLRHEHNTAPVHSFSELRELCQKFPRNIQLFSARKDQELVAGVLMFNHKKLVAHSQYIASRRSAHADGALDFLLGSAISYYAERGFRYFDFGISNTHGGQVLNDTLYRYKRSFGAGSVVHNFFSWDLRKN